MAHHVWTFVTEWPRCASHLVNGNLGGIGRYEIGMQRVPARHPEGVRGRPRGPTFPPSPVAGGWRAGPIGSSRARNSIAEDFLRGPVCPSVRAPTSTKEMLTPTLAEYTANWLVTRRTRSGEPLKPRTIDLYQALLDRQSPTRLPSSGFPLSHRPDFKPVAWPNSMRTVRSRHRERPRE
jgi:hypothetical protein